MKNVRAGRMAVAMLSCLAVPVFAATWEGGGDNGDWTNTLNWAGGTVPSGDTVIFDAGATNQFVQGLGGQDWSVAGLSLVSPGGAVTVNAGNTLAVGAGGIDLSLATQNLTLNPSLSLGAAQSWTVGGGRTLAIGGAVANGGNLLTVDGAGNTTVSGNIGGGGGLLKSGNGTLSLAVQSAYTGGTVVNGGTLALTGGGGVGGTIRGTVTVSNGATLQFASGDVTGYGTGSDRLSTMNIADGARIYVSTTANQTLGNATINLTGARIEGVGNSNLDFFQGGSALNSLLSPASSTIGGVKLQIRQTGGLTVTVASGATNGIDLDVSSVVSSHGSFTAAPLIKAGNGTMRITTAATYSGPTVVNGGRLWIANQLRSTSGITVNAGATNELGAVNIFVGDHGTAMAASRVIAVNGGVLLMNGSFDSRFGNVTLSNGAVWTSNRGLGAWDALLANVSTGAATVAVTGTGASAMNGTGGIHLQGVQNFNVADVTGDAGVDLAVDMILAAQGNAGGAAGGVNKLGAGTMRLNKVNTYTGGTVVNEGTLTLGTGGADGAIRGSLTVNPGATVDYAANNAFGYVSGTSVNELYINGGTVGGAAYGNHFWNSFQLRMTGGTLNLGGTLNEFQNATITVSNSSSTAQILRAAGNGTAVMRLRDNTSATFNVEDGSQATDLYLTAPITQSGVSGIAKTGAGTMLLDMQNTYTGGTVVNGGVLAVDGNQQQNRLTANHPVTVNGAGSVFEIRGVNALATAAGSVDVALNTGGTLRVVSGGSADIGAGGTSHTHVRNLNLSGGVVDLAYSGGGFAYNGESFQLNGTVTVGGSAMSVIQTAGTPDNTGVALNGNRPFVVDDVAAGADLAVYAELENTDTTPADDGFTKLGAGEMMLAGTNTYSGATVVGEGLLRVDGAILGTSGVTVSNGASLAGSGEIAGALAFLSGATLAPGSSPGRLTVSNGVTMASGSIFSLELAGYAPGAGGYDQLLMAGAADTFALDNAVLTVDAGAFIPTNGAVFTVVSGFEVLSKTAGFNGDALTVLDNNSTEYAIGYGSSDITLTVIPEPATIGLLGVCGLAALLRLRRRRPRG